MNYTNTTLNRLIFTLAFSASALMQAKSYKEISTMDQYNSIYKSSKPTAIMYSTPSCNPCKKMEPNFDQAAQQFEQIQFFKLDISKSEFNSLIEKNNILGVPVIIYSKDGKEYKRDRKGAMTFTEIKQSVETFIDLIDSNKSESKSHKNKVKHKKTKKSNKKHDKKRTSCKRC